MTELPRIISVDDHVIEPAHLFGTWLPKKYQDRGPKPLTAGIGELAYVGGKYQITMDPDGPPTDWWIYEDLKFPYKRNIAAVGFDRDEMTLEGITRAAGVASRRTRTPHPPLRTRTAPGRAGHPRPGPRTMA
jgi:hypothetical protein